MTTKSDDCNNNDHGSCKGIIRTGDSSTITKICSCPCHDSTYQLVRKSIALLNQSKGNNPFEFTHDSES